MRSVRNLLTVLLVACFVLTAAGTVFGKDLLEEVLDKKVIRVGFLYMVPPFGMLDDAGNPTGFDADFAKVIADALGVKLEIVKIMTANRVPYLQTGQVDVVVGVLSRTVERELAIDYSVPYVRSGGRIAVRVDEEDIKEIDNLNGIRVSATKGAIAPIWVRRLAPQAKLVEYDYEPDQLQALLSGKVRASVTESYIIDGWMREFPGKIKVVGKPFYEDYVAVGFRQGLESYTFKEWIDWFILEKHLDGTLEKLWNKWFEIPWMDAQPNPFF